MAAEVTRVFRELQLDTEGGLVPARGGSVRPYSRSARGGSVPPYSRRRVKDDSAAVGAAKADSNMAVARNKDVVGTFIGVTKAELANKKASGTSMVKAASWSDFVVTKADAGNKEAAGSITGEIGVTKAGPWNQEAAGSFIGEIGVTKADEAAGSFTGEIGVTKAEPGNKEAAGSFAGEIGATKADAGNKVAAGSITGDIDFIKAEVGAAGKGVVPELEWIQFVFPRPPVELLERKAVTTGALITKEMVPDVIMDRLLRKRPFKKLPPLPNSTGLYDRFPEIRDSSLATIARWNYLIDLQADVVNQHEKKGFAEVGVDFTGGVKKVFILPKVCAKCAP